MLRKLLKPLFFLLMCFAESMVIAQEDKAITLVKEATNIAALKRLKTTFEEEENLLRERLRSKGLVHQWKIVQKGPSNQLYGLHDIGDDGSPLYYTTFMNPLGKVSRADALYENGSLQTDVNGDGEQLEVWDAGWALTTHQELMGRVSNAEDETGAQISDHTTSVVGALVSLGKVEKVRGVAYGAKAMVHDWFSDKREVTKAVANGLLVSNHSYGIKTDAVPDWYFGAYIKTSRDWDKIMFNAPYYLMVSAAGNAHLLKDNETPIYGNVSDGYDLLLGFNTSKNGLVVAGADAVISSDGSLAAGLVSQYSSYGPVDDGRVKPDLAGDGTLVYSTGALNNTNYRYTKGTSMATPTVAGSLLLLQQYHKNFTDAYLKAATLKGLALHTADDVGTSGPDYQMGWGVINTKRAAETIKGNGFNSLVLEERLFQDEKFELTVNVSEGEQLSVSLSWTDPEGEQFNQGILNSPNVALVNDLDIRVEKDGELFYPWKLDPYRAGSPATKGDNTVDPFERIDVDSSGGRYTIQIGNKGKLKNGFQDFSLIVTGLELSSCSLAPPVNFDLTQIDDVSVTFGWDSGTGDYSHEIWIKEKGADWQVKTVEEDHYTWLGPENGKSYTVKLRALCSSFVASEFSRELEFEFNGKDSKFLWMQKEGIPIRAIPNPVLEELYIDGGVLLRGVEYSIFSVMGKKVSNGKLDGAIDVSSLDSGIYVLNIVGNNSMGSTKFIKK